MKKKLKTKQPKKITPMYSNFYLIHFQYHSLHEQLQIDAFLERIFGKNMIIELGKRLLKKMRKKKTNNKIQKHTGLL